MYQAPPPPVVRKPTPWALIIVILLAGFLAVVGICAFGGYLGYRAVTTDPAPRKGFGQPALVEYLDEGWARYRFPEVPLSLEMPALPKPDKLAWEAGDSLLVSGWIYYSCRSELNGIEILGQWYAEEDLYSIEEEKDYIEGFVADVMDSSDVRSTWKKAKYGKLDGYLFSGDLTSDGEAMKYKCFLASDRKRSLNFFAYYYPESKAEAEAEFLRMVGSIREE